MYETLIQIFLGWPAMLLSLGFAIGGILFRRTAVSVVGAFLFVLPGWYLWHYSPVFALVPVCVFGAAYAGWKQKYALASWLILPQFVVLVALGIVVLTQ